MHIDIPAHIEKLLFLHDTLTIPGFGTFTATKASATPDYSAGTISPPSKSLTFSENITTDDGVLVNDVAVANGVSSEEARRVIADFVEKMQTQLGQREIVTLPAVGRLYKNYVQKIQFLPDTTNFSPESFGLPPLQFSPIGRSREVEKSQETPAPAAGSTFKTTTTPAPPPASTVKVPATPQPLPEPYAPASARSGGAGWATALGIFLLFCALSGGYWLWERQKDKMAKAENDKIERIANPLPGSGKTNESPKKTEVPVLSQEKTPTPASEEAELNKKAQESLAEKTKAAREEIQKSETTPKGGRECILVVATLSEKANADRLEQMLKEEGFKIYYLQRNGYQVGIRFYYNNIQEVQDKIKTLQNLTGEQDIWIKKK